VEPWIKFIELVTKPVSVASTFVVFFATSFLLLASQALLARLGLSQALSEHRSAVGLGFIFSAAWVFVTILSAGYRITASRLSYFKSKREEHKQIIAAIPQLTETEKQIIGYLLSKNQTMFTNTFDCGHAATLVSKGFVVRALKPGQSFVQLEVPFEVPQRVWKILLEHKDKFPKPTSDRHPWRVHWMA
jgi:hypothetical protein